ncbi:MAG: hypothetical protein FWD57_15900, partial [Polyangiaceae bacterium]|nr:hypothetical protein [Polyangiaceae bacterium]
KKQFFNYCMSAAICLLLVLAFAPLAHGQVSGEEKSAARAAATSGKNAYLAENHQLAIQHFERANQFYNAPTHTIYLARAHASLGHLLKARQLYRDIIREKYGPEIPAFLQAQQEARDEIGPLEARIPRVTIVIEGAVVGEEVLAAINSKEIPVHQIGRPMLVDPGTYKVRAASKTSVSQTETVSLAEGESKSVTLVMESVVFPGDEQPKPPPPPKPCDKAPRGTSILTFVGAGAIGGGVVAMGFAGYFLAANQSADSKYNDAISCRGPGNMMCDPADEKVIAKHASEMNTAKTNATISLVTGGVALAAGVSLILLAPSPSPNATKPKPQNSAATVQPWVGLGSAGVLGTF